MPFREDRSHRSLKTRVDSALSYSWVLGISSQSSIKSSLFFTLRVHPIKTRPFSRFCSLIDRFKIRPYERQFRTLKGLWVGQKKNISFIKEGYTGPEQHCLVQVVSDKNCGFAEIAGEASELLL